MELSDKRHPIARKLVFKKKLNAKGRVKKYKARLVVKCYSRVEEIEFCEIISLIANLTSIRFTLVVVVAFDLEVEHMDTKTTSLHGDLEEEIYMKQP